MEWADISDIKLILIFSDMEFLHEDLSGTIIKAYYNVYNKLGYGFLEKVYENAMMIELDKFGLESVKQQRITVLYDDTNVGDYFADIIVEQKVILELKAEASLHPRHKAQLVNYLKATNIEVGLLLNFGAKPEFSRKVFSNK